MYYYNNKFGYKLFTHKGEKSTRNIKNNIAYNCRPEDNYEAAPA
jgi:hypothetical protein